MLISNQQKYMTNNKENIAASKRTDIPWLSLAPVAIIFAAVMYAFRDGLILMVKWWENWPEYNHGYLIPFVAAYLLLLTADRYRESVPQRSWSGLLVFAAGLALLVLGELSAVYTIMQYGFLVTLAGIVIFCVGWKSALILWAPFAYLFFMIPLPDFLYQKLSSELQLLSSQFGVSFLRMVGISVFLEGNVIDLGVFKLQVAEACSGLRYLFPLMSFGFLCAYLFNGKVWQKVFIFLSSIPITLVMNSFRIAVIGVLVEYFGISMARGFLHDFEGWIVFMACVGILFTEMWVFALIGRRKLADVFDVRVPPLSDFEVFLPTGKPSGALALLTVVVITTSFGLAGLQNREEIVPELPALNTFPLRVANWRGNETAMEQVYLNKLMLDDYVMAQYYREDDAAVVDLYIAYYASQRKGASVHSPKACLPGGGWEIVNLQQTAIPDVGPDGDTLNVNRVVIQLGDTRQLVYYWFQQRDRIVTNEYLVKWFIFWDALTKNRTDGSLIRLVTVVPPSGKIEDADARMQEFLRDIDPTLAYFLPRDVTSGADTG
jgi:exosortase D (VPLPA-CTERM-specific)